MTRKLTAFSNGPIIAQLLHLVVCLTYLFTAASGPPGTGAVDTPLGCVCAADYMPVCGNFRTYRNRCVAACALGSAGKWTPGSCTYSNPFDKCNADTSVTCPADPCLASHGTCPGTSGDGLACEAVRCTVSTLPSGRAVPACSAVWISTQTGFIAAVCPPVIKLDDCICPATYDPVCTTSNRTMENACEALCQGYNIKDKGECETEGGGSSGGGGGTACDCTALLKPVCGQDGRTYPNECEAQCVGTQVVYAGPCRGSSHSPPPPGQPESPNPPSLPSSPQPPPSPKPPTSPHPPLSPHPPTSPKPPTSPQPPLSPHPPTSPKPPTSPQPPLSPHPPTSPKPPTSPYPPTSPKPPSPPSQPPPLPGPPPLVPSAPFPNLPISPSPPAASDPPQPPPHPFSVEAPMPAFPLSQPDSCYLCSHDYVPVCGTDGKTYPSRCVAECVQRSIRRIGKCQHCNGEECYHAKKNDMCILGSTQCWAVKYECRPFLESGQPDVLGRCVPKWTPPPTAAARQRRRLSAQ